MILYSRGSVWVGFPHSPFNALLPDGGIRTPLMGLCPGKVRLLPAFMPLSALPHIQKVAYTTVLQEWLRLACRSDAHPELVRRHLVTFRAMSSRLLDYVVNIADSNGNTALHYSVSHANFPVVRQLLDSGESRWVGRGALGQGAGSCLPTRLAGLMGKTPPFQSGGEEAGPTCSRGLMKNMWPFHHPQGPLCDEATALEPSSEGQMWPPGWGVD